MNEQLRYTVAMVVSALIVAIVVLGFAPAQGQVVPEENTVGYWCEDGIKYEPVDTPFIVPAPPEGTTWTLIVLKAGTTNETGLLPLEGQSYSHSEHENSHIILCWEETPSDTTTTTQETTTTTTSTPTTTVIDTTTTDPSTTTSSSTPTTTTSLGTTTSLPTSTTTTTTLSTSTSSSTVPLTTPTTTPKELPLTGANVTGFGIAGMAALLTGGFVLAVAKADR